MSEQPKPTWGRALYLLVMLVIITLLHNYNCNHSAAGAQQSAVAPAKEPGRPPEPNGHNKHAMSTEAAPATETPTPAPAETEPKTEEQPPAAPPTEPPPAQPE